MKRILAFLLSFSVILTCIGGLSISVFAEGTLQGSGTLDDPYLISSAADFALIANDLSADYKQTADFTVTAPITGTFTGTYDGDGHTINAQIGVAIEAAADPVGLFLKVQGNSDTDYAEIKNLTLEGEVKSTNTSLKSQTGAFIGSISAQYVKLTNLTNRASVYSKCSGDEVGGLVGRAYAYNIVVENCVNYGKIEAWSYAGGFFGMGGGATNVTITNCANYGTIHGATAGGMVGWAYEITFDSCVNFGLVKSGTSSSSRAAGVTPYVSRSVVINNCFNAGEIIGTTKAGLLNDANPNYGMTITNSYNAFPGVSAFITEGAVANTVTNMYNIEITDTIATVVTDDELAELNISDAFMLYEDRASYPEYENSSYRYPQLKTNFVKAEAVVGKGTAADPYLIATGEQFNKLFGQDAEASVFKGAKYYYIVDDVDISDVDYIPYDTPTASSSVAFSGYVYGMDFDGNPVQRTIYFGTMGSASAPLKGMPNKAGGTTFYTGAVAGIIGASEFKNLTLEGTLYAGANYAGGLTGYVNGAATIDNIINNMDIISTAGYAGGVAGSNTNAGLVLTNCVNNGDISGTTDIAGILGAIGRAPKTFKNNKNSGHIKSIGAGNQYVGGVIGIFTGTKTDNFTLTIDGCVNEGLVESPKGYVGGIIGSLSQQEAKFKADLYIKNSKNIGTVKGANYVGGILGGTVLDPTKCDSSVIIENCSNSGEIYATNQYVGGIAGSAFNSKISFCQNTGKITNTYAASHSYTGGVLGFIKILRSEGDFGMYNSFNAGEISYMGTRNGGLIGYIWKEVASGDNVATYEIRDSYAVGELTTTGTNKINGSFLGSIYRKTGYANDGGVIVSGCYSTLPYIACGALWSAPYNTPLTVSDSYNASTLASAETGYELISNEELINLTNKEGSTFSDNETWIPSSNGYVYPQLVGNIYNVKLTPVPSMLEVNEVDGRYILTWSSKEEPVSGYKVLVDGVQYGEITTAKSFDITDAVEGKIVALKVVAIDTVDYESEELLFSAVFSGGIGMPEDPYVVTTKEQLALISSFPSASYIQGANIEGVTEEIGLTKANPFTGTYDGAGYSIDLDIETVVSDINGGENIGGGLFPYVSGSVVIKNLSVTGEVKGNCANVGAIVGIALTDGFTFTNLKNYATVTGSARETAGIIGRTYHKGTIKNCYNYGDVTNTGTTSGVVGVLSSTTKISECGNYGNITGGSTTAGICAWSYAGISNSFNVGKIKGATAVGIIGQVQSHFDSAGKPTYTSILVKDCYNLGTLEGAETYGIADRANGRDGAYSITGCYNGAYAEYPISDLTDEFVASFNAEWADTDNGKFVVSGVTDCYYLSLSDAESVNAGATKVATREALEAITFASSTAFEKSGDLKYPQLKTNKLDADKDDIELVKLSLDLSAIENTNVSIVNFYDNNGAFIKKGDAVSVIVYANEYFAVEAYKNAASLGIFTERTELLVEVNGDTVISATEETVDVVEPDGIHTADKVYTPATGDVITVGEKDYNRFAIVAGRIEKGTGLRLSEFGALISRTENEFDLASSGVVKAQADAEKINENGWYGILIHGDSDKGLKDGFTYYTRPYAIYADKDGNTYTVYGNIQGFVLDAVE